MIRYLKQFGIQDNYEFTYLNWDLSRIDKCDLTNGDRDGIGIPYDSIQQLEDTFRGDFIKFKLELIYG